MGVSRRSPPPVGLRRSRRRRACPRCRRSTGADRRSGARPGAALAAIRETFEETGLIVGRPGQGRVSPASEWADFLATGHLADLAGLDFVARAITPPARSRRFDARFFTVDASRLVALEPGPGCGELDEIAWFDWAAAAALDLPSITRAILAEVALRDREPGRPIPYHRFDRGRHRLLAV